jgi:Fic family protein
MKPPTKPLTFLEANARFDSAPNWSPERASFVRDANWNCWNWDEVRYRCPSKNLNPDHAWFFVKLERFKKRPTPIRDVNGRPFTFWQLDSALPILHRADLRLGGTVGSPFADIETGLERDRFLLTSLQEEAYASSLIEGAVATREQAQDLIRKGRPPKTESERMILNNYRTIRFLNERRDEDLTVDRLCEVQTMLTEGTLKDESQARRFRLPHETIHVVDEESNDVLHVPPAADELPQRMANLCAFANHRPDPKTDDDFIHPVLRACLLHFWLAYDHPFCDGNGRTARALFYWSMLRNGYWLTEYLSISTAIAERRKQYAMAYLNSETDENDVTYFLHFHLKCLELSLNSFEAYFARKVEERNRMRDWTGLPINDRQIAILQRAIKDPVTVFTFESHMNSHGITLATARTDMLGLEELGFLIGNRSQRPFTFVAARDLSEKISKGQSMRGDMGRQARKR